MVRLGIVAFEWKWTALIGTGTFWTGKDFEAIYPWELHVRCKGVGVSSISLSFRFMHCYSDIGWNFVPMATQRGSY
jgi:hypothetical protein